MASEYEHVKDEDAIKVMADKIFTANFDDPNTGDGTTRDQIHIGENAHYARAALRGLHAAGFVVCKKKASDA